MQRALSREFGLLANLRTVFSVLACCVSVPTSVRAQPAAVAPVPGSVRAKITVTNVLMGAAAGGVRAWLGHRPIRRGLLLGAGGGLATAAGRQVVATRGTAAGLVGRVVHDVGLGLASAAVDSVLTVPIHLGPLVARWTPASRRWPTVRANVTNLIFAAAVLRQRDSRIDWRSSLWSGTITVLPYLNASTRAALPQAYPGTIRLDPLSTFCFRNDAGEPVCRVDLAHESIHVLQLDMMHEWIGRPVEHAAIRRLPVGRHLARWLELGAVGPLAVQLLDQQRRYDTRWTEYEASWLTEGIGPPKLP